MLFLLNNQIIEIDAPELHLSRYWKRIGCGEPTSLRASDAVDFAVRVVNAHTSEGIDMEETVQQDLAALIVAKTGANAALFDGSRTARLNILPEAVLAGLADQRGIGSRSVVEEIWSGAA